MANPDFLNPIWVRGFHSNQRSFQSFKLQQPRPVDPTSIASQDLPEAEKLLRENRNEEAAAVLEPLAPSHDMAKRLLLQAFVGCNNKKGIIRCFYDPFSSEEIIAVCDALWEEGQLNELREILARPAVATNQDPSVVHIRTKFLGRLGE